MNTRSLWEQIQSGNQGALKAIFDRHYSPLCGYLLQYTQDIDLAEDIVQTVFINLWEKKDHIIINQSLKSYLYKSCHNSFLDNVRYGKRQESMLYRLQYEALAENINEDKEVFEAKIDRLKKEMDKLPPKCKEILLMSKREGLKYQEISERLNISIKTVETQMRLAYQKIREAFKNDGLFLFMLFDDFGFYIKKPKISV